MFLVHKSPGCGGNNLKSEANRRRVSSHSLCGAQRPSRRRQIAFAWSEQRSTSLPPYFPPHKGGNSGQLKVRWDFDDMKKAHSCLVIGTTWYDSVNHFPIQTNDAPTVARFVRVKFSEKELDLSCLTTVYIPVKLPYTYLSLFQQFYWKEKLAECQCLENWSSCEQHPP